MCFSHPATSCPKGHHRNSSTSLCSNSLRIACFKPSAIKTFMKSMKILTFIQQQHRNCNLCSSVAQCSTLKHSQHTSSHPLNASVCDNSAVYETEIVGLEFNGHYYVLLHRAWAEKKAISTKHQHWHCNSRQVFFPRVKENLIFYVLWKVWKLFSNLHYTDIRFLSTAAINIQWF